MTFWYWCSVHGFSPTEAVHLAGVFIWGVTPSRKQMKGRGCCGHFRDAPEGKKQTGDMLTGPNFCNKAGTCRILPWWAWSRGQIRRFLHTVLAGNVGNQGLSALCQLLEIPTSAVNSYIEQPTIHSSIWRSINLVFQQEQRLPRNCAIQENSWRSFGESLRRSTKTVNSRAGDFSRVSSQLRSVIISTSSLDSSLFPSELPTLERLVKAA